MCKALLAASAVSDKSATAMDLLVNSLSSAYNPSQVTSPEGHTACASVMNYLLTLAAEGYLVGTLPSTAAFLTSTASAFITHNNTKSSASISATNALASITTGVLAEMVNNDPPTRLVSDGIRISIQKPLISGMKNASLAPPETAAEAAYGLFFVFACLQPLSSYRLICTIISRDFLSVLQMLRRNPAQGGYARSWTRRLRHSWRIRTTQYQSIRRESFRWLFRCKDTDFIIYHDIFTTAFDFVA